MLSEKEEQEKLKEQYEREQKNKYQKEYQEKLRLDVLRHYTKNPSGFIECAECHEMLIPFLTIDHISGGGTKQLEELGGGYSFYLWLRRNNYPEGYQVLCRLCHDKKHNLNPPKKPPERRNNINDWLMYLSHFSSSYK